MSDIHKNSQLLFGVEQVLFGTDKDPVSVLNGVRLGTHKFSFCYRLDLSPSLLGQRTRSCWTWVLDFLDKGLGQIVQRSRWTCCCRFKFEQTVIVVVVGIIWIIWTASPEVMIAVALVQDIFEANSSCRHLIDSNQLMNWLVRLHAP